MTSAAPEALRQVVFLASIDWDAAYQRHQALAEAFAQGGSEVFFVENTGFRDLKLADLGRVRRRLGSAVAAPPRGRTPVEVVSPLVLPPTAGVFRLVNRLLLVPLLARSLRRRGLRPGATVFAYLPTDTTLALLDELEPGAVVYDCVDHFAGHPNSPADLERTEDELLRRSACVLATSPFLEERLRPRHPRVHRIHHGVSEDYFRIPPAAPRDYRRLCYFGSVWGALDYRPVAALAEAGFEVTLLGPVNEPPPPLPASVRLEPPVPAAELPAALARHDALLLPYTDSPYNQGVTPSKTFECLATGKPVLASALPGLREFEGLIYLLDGPEEFVRAARALSSSESEDARRARVDCARGHSRAKAVARIREAIAAAPAAPPAPARGLLPVLARGLGWIGSLFALARLSTFVVQAIAGRLLGPAEYGRSSLVIASAALLQVLPILGFPTAISRFVSAEDSQPRRRLVVSTLWWTFAAWAAASLCVLGLLGGRLAGSLGVEPGLLRLALAYAGLTALYTVASSPLQGLRRFRERGLAEAVYGLGAVAALVAGAALGFPRTHHLFIGSLCAALATAGTYALFSLRDSLDLAWDGQTLRRTGPYMALATLNLLTAAAVITPGRMFLHQSHDAAAVGVFSAYFASTIQVALAMLTVASTVVIPLGSSRQGQDELWRHYGRAWPALGAAAWAGLFACCCLALLVFGSRYPLIPSWAALFAAAGALVLVHGLAASLFAAAGFEGLLVSVAGGLIAGGTNLALTARLAPSRGVAGAGLAVVLGYALGGLWYAAAALKASRTRP